MLDVRATAESAPNLPTPNRLAPLPPFSDDAFLRDWCLRCATLLALAACSTFMKVGAASRPQHGTAVARSHATGRMGGGARRNCGESRESDMTTLPPALSLAVSPRGARSESNGEAHTDQIMRRHFRGRCAYRYISYRRATHPSLASREPKARAVNRHPRGQLARSNNERRVS